MKQEWPETALVLTGADFCRGKFTDGECHCLVGWCGVVFGGSGRGCHLYTQTYKALLKECEIECGFCLGFVSCFNDDPTNSLATLARVWNRFIARLSYVVNNPEAKRLTTKRRRK